MALPPYRRTCSKQLLVAGCWMSGNQHPSPDRGEDGPPVGQRSLEEECSACSAGSALIVVDALLSQLSSPERGEDAPPGSSEISRREGKLCVFSEFRVDRLGRVAVAAIRPERFVPADTAPS